MALIIISAKHPSGLYGIIKLKMELPARGEGNEEEEEEAEVEREWTRELYGIIKGGGGGGRGVAEWNGHTRMYQTQ